mgnify:CR=1 FL=1
MNASVFANLTAGHETRNGQFDTRWRGVGEFEKVIDRLSLFRYNGFVGNCAKIANISCGILRYMVPCDP